MTRARDLADGADKDIAGTLTLDDIVLSNDMSVADNGKVQFGAGNDLQIYHDGSNSVIKDNGTGKLILDTDGTSIEFQKSGLETLATFNTDGAITLYHDNSAKLATTSTGVDVTGSVTVSNDGALFFGDTSTYISGSGAADRLKFITNGSEAVRIDSSQRVGIGTSTPTNTSGLEIQTTSTTAGLWVQTGGTSSSHIISEFRNGANVDVLKIRGDASSIFQDKVGIGTSSPTGKLHIKATSDSVNDALRIESSINSHYYTLSSDAGNGSFRITKNGTERMRIDSSGNLLIGKTSRDFNTAGIDLNIISDPHFVRDGNTVCSFNRLTNDGTLINFGQAGSIEGSISVSGSTVSYNGGHLSRWSQLADNIRDGSIVKGTVMTNLDQMAEWTNEGVTEDNEQLNCMAVSTVEGDPNVAGVFVNWDNDDEIYTNDMNVAMTGDMVIRIAQGTTVARGDLLMSAGDGPAKPQGDDIVRSKTIAKVTSTNVSHTYNDGTYLVPCVLMAC